MRTPSPLFAIACCCICCLNELIDLRVWTASACVLFEGLVGEGGFGEDAFMVAAYPGVVGELGNAEGDVGFTSMPVTDPGFDAGLDPGWCNADGGKPGVSGEVIVGYLSVVEIGRAHV